MYVVITAFSMFPYDEPAPLQAVLPNALASKRHRISQWRFR